MLGQCIERQEATDAHSEAEIRNRGTGRSHGIHDGFVCGFR
jgi:hypothetical protein